MKTFACACGPSFTKRTSLDQHIDAKKGSLRCSCNTPSKTRRELEMHARAQGHVSCHAEETRLWPPPVKGKPNAKSLPANSSKHQCDRCPTKKSFSSAAALCDHLKAKHEGHSIAVLRFASNDCPLCDRKNFSSTKGVLDHINNKHQGSRKAPDPPICSRTRSKAKTAKTPTQPPSNASTFRRYCCRLCSRRFSTEDGLGHHATIKHREMIQQARDSAESKSTQPSDSEDAESLSSDKSDASSRDEEPGGVRLVSLEPTAFFEWCDAFDEENGELSIECEGRRYSTKPWDLLEDIASPLGALESLQHPSSVLQVSGLAAEHLYEIFSGERDRDLNSTDGPEAVAANIAWSRWVWWP